MNRAKLRRQRQRGVALLMVLIALTILGAMTANLMETNEVHLATAVNMRDATQAEYVARSAVNLSRLMLSFQRLLGRTFNYPFWQFADLIIPMFADPAGGSIMADLAGADLSDVKGLGLKVPNSELGVTIIDEDSKINVNVANDQGRRARDQMFKNLMSLMQDIRYDHIFDKKTEDGAFLERDQVICEIIDWSDPDDELCNGLGGEDPSVYQMLEPEYKRKNAPFDSLEELHLVRGVDEDFWAAFVDPVPEEPDKRVMTVWGSGKVNVNTASMQALAGLICSLLTDESGISQCATITLNPEFGMAFYSILQYIANVRTISPFSNHREFTDELQNPGKKIGGDLTTLLGIPGLTIPAHNRIQARRMFSTRSTVFSIYAEGTVGRVTKRIHTVVDMKGQDMINPTQSVAASGGSILYWRME